MCSFIRPKRLTLRPYKEYWFVFKDTTISYYKNKEASSGEPIEQFHLRGQWVQNEKVCVAGGNLCISIVSNDIPGFQLQAARSSLMSM